VTFICVLSESGEVTQPLSKEVQAVLCVKSPPSCRYKRYTMKGTAAN
jgi:hypothetical protein